jgi:hypothetical protein
MRSKIFLIVMAFTISFFVRCNLSVQNSADSDKAIIDFYFLTPQAIGVIDEETKSIIIEVPAGTDISSLTPVIIHTGKSIHPDSGCAQDFSKPVVYSVTAADGSVQQYIVEVFREIADSGKAITDFYFLEPSVKGAIDEETKSIIIEVPAGTDISSLTPVIVHTGKSIHPDSGCAQDFSKPVVYSVTAADGSVQQYIVEVYREIADSGKAITEFYFLEPSVKGIIDEELKMIFAGVPADVDISSLTPVITHTGESIHPGSGVTQNFSEPVIYSVTAADGSVQQYLVEVKSAISDSDKAITDFYLPGLKTRGLIVENAKEIYIVLPSKSDIQSVKSNVKYVGKSISPGSTEILDFTDPVQYTVTALDGSQSIYSVIVKKSDLPVLYINTPNSVPVSSKEVWIEDASYKLIDENGFIFSGHVSIKGRGNSTMAMPKTPFTIKLPKNDDKPFLGMPSHNRWVLLANYSDKSLLRNDVAFKLGEILDNLKWTPKARHIVLYLNENYQGVYQLVEQIRIDPNRVNIAPAISSKQPNGGYIIEADARRGELFNFITNLGLNISCKDPDENLEDVFENIKTHIQAIEDVIYSDSFADTVTGYRRYIDVGTFVDWYLANEIAKNNDAIFFNSVYIYYNPADKKISMGPLWDFDLAFGNVDYSECQLPEDFYIKNTLWISRLFEDTAFVRMVKNRWNEKRTEIYTLLSYIKSQASYLNNAQQINFKKWDILDVYVWPNAVVTGSYEGEIDYLHSWLSTRLNWLDMNINLLDSN